MKRYQSGAEKRKKRKEREVSVNKLSGSLASFFRQARPETSTSNESELLDDADLSKVSQQNEQIQMAVPVSSDHEVIAECSEKRDNLPPPELEVQMAVETETSISIPINYPVDIALWPLVMTEKMKEFYLIKKPNNIGIIENLKTEYTDRDRKYFRNITDSSFYCLKANGTREMREWLIFSETTKCIYCYICKLFSTSSSKLTTGYNDWKNVSWSLEQHESSKDHIIAMCTFVKRSSIAGRVDTALHKQIETERKYWREVLYRIVATIKLLSGLGIAFRGHNESESSSHKGNYLTCLEYLSEFDPFLKRHMVKYTNCGSGKTNYLSHQICTEFVSLMAKRVRESIVSEIQEAKYYSIVVDSTPDISHIDQLSFIFRYISNTGEIKERFLCFLAIDQHDAGYLEKTVLDLLSLFSIDIGNCRGQSYDNAANMSGKYSGLQARLKEHSPNAYFLPCASHSLNLVGNRAAESCSQALHFFDFVQNLYVFFSASTKRWNLLTSCLQEKCIATNALTLKRVSDTRWSARADAVSALKQGYVHIKEVLINISLNNLEKPTTQIEAKKLSSYFDDYETGLLVVCWNKLLERINATSKSLQDKQSNVLKGSKLLDSLSNFIIEARNNFQEIEMEAEMLIGNQE